MGYFNYFIKCIIRGFARLFTRSIKSFFMIILVLLVICMSLLLLNNKVFAFSFSGNSNYTYTIPDQYEESNYIIIETSNRVHFVVSPTSDMLLYTSGGTYYIGAQNWGKLTYIVTGIYKGAPIGTTNLVPNIINGDTGYTLETKNFDDLRFVGGNITIHYSNNVIYEPSPSFQAPYLSNMKDQTSQEILESGQFTYFIVEPGSIPKSQDILMDVYDTTYSDSANTIVDRYVLNENCGLIVESETYENGYAYFIPARFLSWFQIVNGKSYKIRLSWVNPDNILQTDSVEYNWTMSLTAEQQTIEEQTTQQEINEGISNLNNSINDLNNTQQETNDFLKDNTFDENIIKMPSVEFNENYTNYGDRIFTLLKNVFTSDNYVDFEFTVPFTDKKIIIPSNYIESHLPQIIINLIRLVYWYVIGRFVLKDILKTIDKLRQGDFFLQSEEDIKTEVL